jgi:hypothetical protein
MKHWTFPVMIAAFCAASACEMQNLDSSASHSIQTIGFAQDAPEGAAAGTCWGKTVSPAVIETVNREVLLHPAQVSSDGRIQKPATYKKEDIQQIVQPRRDTWFETVCPNLLTESFVASLQRALSARGSYRGDVTGLMDDRTRRAIRKFQLGGGFDSGNLTVASARTLGLVAVPRTSE